MKKFVVLFALFGAAAAQADSYVCDSEDGIRIRANDSVMVVSDTNVGAGRKTIARFTSANGTLDVEYDHGSELFSGKVDLRFNDSARAGELLFGTRLGEIAEINLSTDSHVPEFATATIVKRNGRTKSVELTCE